jgi:hypothetical protein
MTCDTCGRYLSERHERIEGKAVDGRELVFCAMSCLNRYFDKKQYREGAGNEQQDIGDRRR